MREDILEPWRSIVKKINNISRVNRDQSDLTGGILKTSQLRYSIGVYNEKEEFKDIGETLQIPQCILSEAISPHLKVMV